MQLSTVLAGAFVILFSPLASAISATWTGLGDGVSWSDAANWSGGVLPPAGIDVTISVPASDPTILFAAAAGFVQMNSLTTSEDLTIAGGTLRWPQLLRHRKIPMLTGGTIVGATFNPSKSNRINSKR